MESTSGAVETGLKANGKHVLDTAKAETSLKLEISMWVSTPGARQRATVSTHGAMVQLTADSSSTVRRTDKATGAKAMMMIYVVNTQESIKMIKSTVLANSHGKQAQSLKVIITKT
jgi:hypothetical protein